MRSIGFAVSAGLFVLNGSLVQAEGVEINDLLDTYEIRSDDPDFWVHQNYRAQSMVRSGEYLGARAQQYGHDALGMDEKSPTARAIYLLTSGLVNLKFQTANSLMYGHEYAHFQMWDYYGYRTHYFYDFDDREELSEAKTWWNIFWKGGPEATATNSGMLDPSRDPEQQIMTTAAGNNWQMNYSEEWVRRNIQADGMSLFTVPAYLTNRMKTFTYTISDDHGHNDGVIAGDMTKIEDHYVNVLGHEDGDLSKIALYSGLSILASPATWRAYQAVGDYVATGETEMRSPFFKLGGIEYTWDIPAYLNANGMSLVPTAYVRLSSGLTVGLGVETAVIGDLDDEYTLSFLGDYNGFALAGEYSMSTGGGSHLEMDASYRVNDYVSITASHVMSDDFSLRGFRNNPYGDDLTTVGVQLRF